MRKIYLFLLPVFCLSFMLFAAAPSQASIFDPYIKFVKGVEAKIVNRDEGRIRFHVEHNVFSKGPKLSFSVTVRRYGKSVWGPYDKIKSPLAPYTTIHAHTCNGARAGRDCSIYRYFVGRTIQPGDWVKGTVKACYSRTLLPDYCKTAKVNLTYFNR